MMYLLLLVVLSFATVQSFVIQPKNSARRYALLVARATPSPSAVTTTTNNNNNSNLSSAYPPDTPAGLRGEAVRSALTSGRCIAWDLSSDSSSQHLAQGWIGLEGKGTMDFINNKLSQTVNPTNGSFTLACLLSPKGKVVDTVGVAVKSPTQAFLLTSPGHCSSALFQRLDPLIFPMDQVKLTEFQPKIITLLSNKIQDVQEAIQKYVVPLVDSDAKVDLTDSTSCCLFVSNDLTIVPYAVLPTFAGHGYSLIFNNQELGQEVWEALTGDANPDGPIGIGSLEYETLRIEAGLPAFGNEFGGKDEPKDNNKMIAPGPLELHLQSLLDMNKGCYLGQEGVASVVKNVRGPPRILYCVVFDDESNVYDENDDDKDNLTTIPQVGQELFVLGSNEEIAVGTITSIAEPSGTGDATIVGLALVRRADSILKQMKSMDLTVGADSSSFCESNPSQQEQDGITAPPPLDPLDGLEVIVGGTYTVGKLQMVPSRRYRLGQNMFEENGDAFAPSEDEGSVMGVLNPNVGVLDAPVDETVKEDDAEKALEEAKKAQAEAEAAAAEAKRKEEKMEMLKKRAEEAMARRRKKKT